MAVAVAVTLASLTGPAPGPTVPPAEAQPVEIEVLSRFQPSLTLTGFNTRSGYERAYEDVELVVRYVPRFAADLSTCGVYTETYRIDRNGRSQPHGTKPSMIGEYRRAGRTQSAFCVYNEELPDVTGFGKPTVRQVSGANPSRTYAYSPPTYYSQSAGVWLGQTQALLDDVQRKFSDTPNNVMRYEMTVRPASDAPVGCDANTRSLTEAALVEEIVPDDSTGTNAWVFDGTGPLIRRPVGASTDCVYDVEFGNITGLRGRYIGDSYILDASYVLQRNQVRPGQNAAFRYTLNPSPSPFTPLVPVVSADLPFVDEGGDGRHDMSGETFSWSFARTTFPVVDTNCSEFVQAVYVIDDDGEVELRGTRQSDGSVTPGLELVGRHPDSVAECSYAVTFAANGDFAPLGLHDDRDVLLSLSDPRAHGVFETARRQITFRFQVTGLGVPDGTRFTVELRLKASSDASRCADTRSSESGGWTRVGGVWRNTMEVGTKGFVTLGRVVVLPARWRDSAADACEYDVVWPDFEDPDAGGVARDAYRRLTSPPSGGLPLLQDDRTLEPPRFDVWYRAYYQRSTTFEASPTSQTAASFAQVSAGGSHSCGVQTDGSAACWGSEGDGRASPPAGSFSQVSAGGSHSCGVRAAVGPGGEAAGSVACWGSDGDGQSTPPAGSFTQVSAGGSHSCGVKTDGTVACWGSDADGRASAPPGSFAQVSAGNRHSCGVQTDGSVACWGSAGTGQATPPAGSFTQVAAGGFHSCGLTTDNTVACWGSDGNGRASAPSGSFTQVSAGSSHTCAVTTDGEVTCWGNDPDGRSTPPTSATSPGPSGTTSTIVPGQTTTTVPGQPTSTIVPGPSDTTPGDTTTTTVPGQFPMTSTTTSTFAPVASASAGAGQMPDLPDTAFTQVSAGGAHSCALQQAGSVVCWGDDAHGQSSPPTVPVDGDASSFTPSISVSVPLLEGTTSGENIWAGEELDVTIEPAAGTHVACSLSSPVVVTYTVGVTGLLTTDDPDLPTQLIGTLDGHGTSCEYVVSFSDPATDASDPDFSWTMTAPVAVRLSGSSTSASGHYTVSVITFEPNATITVPPYNGDDDPDTTLLDESTQNAFAGEHFTVPFTSSAEGCDDATLRYTVGPTGTVTADATSATLVAYPAGSSTLCTYAVGFEANEDGGTRLARDANASTSVTGTAQAISATYLGTRTTFEPDVDATVPYVDADGDNVNDIATQTVTVTYTPAITQPSQHANCTDTATETYRVDNGGTFASGGSVTRTTAAALLVDRPAGVNDRCQYTAVFTPSISGNGQGPFDIVANNFPFTKTVAINPTWAGDTRFTPRLTIGVPQVEGLTAGENMFAQTTFTVTIARATGAHTECSAETDIPVTYTVTVSGLVEGTPPALVDRPEEQRAPCVYDLTFPPQVAPPANTQLGWTLTRGAATASVSGDAQTVTANYTVGVVTFTPKVVISVPDYNGDDNPETAVNESTRNAFTGRTFGLVMARSSGPDTGCDAVAETYAVDADGTVSPQDGSVPTLVHLPSGDTSAPCVYDVVYPTHSGTAPVLNRDDTSLDVTTRASDPATAATYLADESTFSPTIEIDVPPAIDSMTGHNLFAGTTLQVRFTQAPGSHEGCSANPATAVTYRVDADGTVTGTPPLLVDRPAKQAARCAYVVTMPTSMLSDTAASLRWTLTRAAGATAGVNGGDAAVTASYTSGPVTFVPTVEIDVPGYNADDDPTTLSVDESTRNAFAGRTFGVSFGRAAGPLSGCETVTETYAVDANGLVAPADGTAPLLVHYPSGESASACVYNVAFPPVVGVGLPLNRQAARLDATTRAADTTAAATYRASQSTFAPTIKIDVPVVDRASAGGSLFADTTFAVTFERAPASHRDCSAETAVTVTYAVDATGDVVGEPPASLVDRPAGQETRCVYEVTTPVSQQSAAGSTLGWTLIRAGGATTSINGGASVVAAAYAVGAITFTPTVTITVPTVDDGQGGNLFAGATFVVSFSPSGGPVSECSPERTLGFTMGESRTLEVSAPELIDVPAGGRDSCVYSVEFPASVNSAAGATPAWTLTDSGTGVASLSAATPTADRAYVGGRTTVAPTSPQRTARTAGTAGSGRSVGRSSGGSARGSGSARSVSVPDAAAADDEPDDDANEPVVVAVDDEFAGFVPSVTERVPIRVSLTMPPANVAVDAVVEVMISAPGVCGSDMEAFGGLPAQVGLVYALNARSGVTAELVEEGAQLLSAFAERGDERRPCALRITVLIAPQGCAFAAAQTDEVGLDDAGRSYAELTWSEDAAAFSLAPTLACEPA